MDDLIWCCYGIVSVVDCIIGKTELKLSCYAWADWCKVWWAGRSTINSTIRLQPNKAWKYVPRIGLRHFMHWGHKEGNDLILDVVDWPTSPTSTSFFYSSFHEAIIGRMKPGCESILNAQVLSNNLHNLAHNIFPQMRKNSGGTQMAANNLKAAFGIFIYTRLNIW